MKTLLKFICLILALCMLCSCSKLAQNQTDTPSDEDLTSTENSNTPVQEYADSAPSDSTSADASEDEPENTEPQITMPESSKAFHTAADYGEIFSVLNGSAQIPYGTFPAEASSSDGRMTVISLNGFMPVNILPCDTASDNSFIYSIQNGNLIITAEGETVSETELFIPDYTIGGEEDNSTEFSYGYENPMALYLAEGKLTVVTSAYTYTETYDEDTKAWNYDNSNCVNTYIFDISDAYAPYLTGTLSQDGIYASSAEADGKLSVISSQNISSMDENDISTYIPHVYTDGSASPISHENIHIFDYSTCSGYTIVAEYDIAETAIANTAAVLGGSGRMYIDETHIYFIFYTETAMLTDTVTENGVSVENYTESCMSAIIKFPMGQDLAPVGQTLVSGCFGNDFSIFTKDGRLFFCAVAEKSHYAVITDLESSTISKKDISAEVENVLYFISPDLKTVSYNFLPNEEISYATFENECVWIGYFSNPLCFNIYTAEPVTGNDASVSG